MTIKEAASAVEKVLMAQVIDSAVNGDRHFAAYIDDAWKIVRKAALEATCKTENRPSDGRTTDKGMFIPESPNEVEKRVSQNETQIEMLWNQIDRIKERMPKEWL